MASKQKGEIRKLNAEGQVITITDDQWEAVTNFTAAKEAYHNYQAVMHLIWPYDPTPLLMLRIMLRYNWLSTTGDDAELRTNLLEAFFNSVLQQNSNRAVNQEVILSFQEMEDILKNQLRSNRVSTEPPVTDRSKKPKGAKAGQNSSQKSSYSQKQYSSGTKEYKTADNKLTCFRYNSVTGQVCTNKIVDSAYPLCEAPTGAKYAHRCSAPGTNGSGICGQKHRRKDHK